MFSTLKPAKAAVAGLVPCALSGTSITLRVSARLQRGLDAQHAAQLAVCPGLGRHRDAMHAGQRRSASAASSLITSSAPCTVCCGAERVDIGKAGQPRDLFVQARIVLHRARTQRERAKVDGIVLARQAGVMAHGFGLGKPRQRSDILAQKPRQRAAARPRLPPRRNRPRCRPARPSSKISGSSSIKRAVAADGCGLRRGSRRCPSRGASRTGVGRAHASTPSRRRTQRFDVLIGGAVRWRRPAGHSPVRRLIRIEPPERHPAQHELVRHCPHRFARVFRQKPR
jgi:hypothetical protein